MRFMLGTAQPSALEEWREAAALVRDRWAQVLVADRGSRRNAYAAYVAALDLEESAAAFLATDVLPLVA